MSTEPIYHVTDAGTRGRVHRSARAESLSKAPARRFHQPAGLHVLGQSMHAVDHDHLVGAGGVMRRLSEQQTTADQIDDHHHNDHFDDQQHDSYRLATVW